MDLKKLITKYCQYQERCQKEVRNKLYEAGARKDEVEELMVMLISEGLINEERFAKSYARGKFRIKHWGKQKIKYELKALQISDYCIKLGLAEIDPEEYDHTIQKLSDKKWAELQDESNTYQKKAKLQRYLTQKGFENDLIIDQLKKLI